MRTFDNGDAFVDVFAEGPRIHHRWGRIDHTSFTRVAVYPNPHQAAHAFHAQIRRLEHRYAIGRAQEAMLAAMHKTPKDPTPFLIYADWLQQYGDPHGVLITRTMQRREAESLLGEDVPHYFPRAIENAKYLWELGFITRAELPVAWPGAVGEIFRHPSAAFIRELSITSDTQYMGIDNWKDLFTQNVPATLERVEVSKKSKLAALALKVPIVVAV